MAADQERVRRLAENETLFRDVNEQVEAAAATFQVHGAMPQEFLCECADERCVERVALTLDEYEAVRANGRQFFVVPGHEIAEVERVVATRGNYNVIEKIGAGVAVADARNPRR